MLVVTKLVQLMEKLDVMNELCQLPSGGPKHAMVKVSGHILYLLEKGDEMRSLPHEGSAWVFTRPKNVALLANEDQFTGDPIQRIRLVDLVALWSAKGDHWDRNHFSMVVA